MAEKEHRFTLRGLSDTQKKALLSLNKNRNTSMNTEILFAIDEYLNEWNLSKPEWFGKKNKPK